MRQNKKEQGVDIIQSHELEINPEAPVNEHFIDIANKFKTAKFLVLLLLVIFTLFMISVFRNDITLENCKYLIRFFSSANTVYSGDYENIYYDTAGVLSIDMFNEDLVTIKNDGIELYNRSGSNVASYEINQVTPTLVKAGKYMLVYDLGGHSFKLFNNFSMLTEQICDYPISCAAVSPEGMYAVVTKSLDYQSVIYLYDHNFNLISKIYKDKYVTDIEIDSKGERLLCTSAVAENGRYRSEISTYTPYTDKQESINALEGVFAIDGGFFSGGEYAALTDNRLVFFDRSNNAVAEYSFGNAVPTNCLILDDYAVLCYNENIVGSQSRVLVFEPDGDVCIETSVDDKILDCDSFGDHLYLLTDQKLHYINMKTSEEMVADVEQAAMAVYVSDNTSVVIGFSNMAKAYKLSELFTETEG